MAGDWWVYALVLPFTFAPTAWFVWRHININYIRPTRYYKLIVFSDTEEFMFFKKKRDVITQNDKTGFILFENKKGVDGKINDKDKEFYCVSSEDLDRPSKRDDFGMTTFYFWRNNANPIKIKSKDSIEIDNDASLLYKLLTTNIFNSATMAEEDKRGFKPNWALIVIIVLSVGVTAFMFFKDKLGGV